MRAERIQIAVACVALVGCAGASPPPAARAASPPPRAATPDALDYRFTFAPDLSAVDVELCFEGPPPPELVCGMRGGSAHLRGAFALTGGGRRPLPAQDGAIALAGVAANGCVQYRIDLAAAASAGFGVDALRRDEGAVLNTALLLWRPRAWQQVARASARFELPQGMRALVPFPREGDRYSLDASAFAFFGFAVFGRFELERVEAASAQLDVAVLDGFDPGTRAHVVPWLTAAVRMAALPAGRFPRERGVIAVVPTPAGHHPVRFGMAARGGGMSVLLLVSPEAELDELISDWVAVHEFSHLLHPFVARDDAWLSEGLATYYQEVTRVRGGVLPEHEAWRRFHAGAALGASARSSLAEESASMSAQGTYERVYWAGASFALLADAELRRRTGGRKSLDDVVRELARCCARAPRPMPAREVIADMDRIAGVPVFSELMKRWVLGPRLPELSGLFRRLGVTLRNDGAQLAPRAEDAWIRAAIMGGGAGNVAAASERPWQ